MGLEIFTSPLVQCWYSCKQMLTTEFGKSKQIFKKRRGLWNKRVNKNVGEEKLKEEAKKRAKEIFEKKKEMAIKKEMAKKKKKKKYV